MGKQKSAFQNYLTLQSLIEKGELDQFKETVKKMSLDQLSEALADANIFYTEFNNNPANHHKSWRNCFEFIWNEVCELRPKMKKDIFNWKLTQLVDPKTPDYVIKEILNFSLKHDKTVTVNMIDDHLIKGHNGLNGEKPNLIILSAFIDNLKSENILVNHVIDLVKLQQKYGFNSDILFKVIEKINIGSINLNPLFEYVMNKVSNHYSFKNDLLILIDKHNGFKNELHQYQLSAIEIDDIESYGFLKIDSFDDNHSVSLYEKRIDNNFIYILEYKNSQFFLSKYEIEKDCGEEIFINKEMIFTSQDCKLTLYKSV